MPRYGSKSSLTTQQPAFQAVNDTSAQVTEAYGEVGKTVQDSATKWGNAVDTIQTTAATANIKMGMADIQNRAANDPNYNNSDEYYKEIDNLVNKNSTGFASKLAESQFKSNAMLDGQIGKIQVENIYKKKLIDVGQASMFTLLDMEAKNPNPDMENRITSILDTQVKAGIIDRKDAYIQKEKYIKKGKYNAFLSDLSQDPSKTEKNLSSNLYDFDVRELKDAKDIYDTESKKIQASNQLDLLNSYLNGQEVSPEQVKSLMQEGKISSTFAESMIDKINNPKQDRPSKDKTYIEFQNKVADMQAKGDKATIEEIINIMGETMQAHAKGLLDTADVERILKDRNEVVQSKLEKSVQKDVLNVVRPKTIFERLSFWTDEYANSGVESKETIKARMYRKMLDGATSNQDPEMLASKVINDEIEIQLEHMRNKPDRIHADHPETHRSAYSDDGGATWFDEKTKKEIK